MPSTTKTFSFNTDAEGLTSAGNDTTMSFAWVSADASVRFTSTTKNHTGTEFARRASTGQTWETWGVPSGATVTDVQITAWTKRLVANTKLSSHSLKARIIGSGGASVHSAGDLLNTALGTTTDGSFVAQSAGTSRAVDSGSQASTTDVRLELEYTLSTSAGGGSASVEQRFDAIEVTITYTTPNGARNFPQNFGGPTAYLQSSTVPTTTTGDWTYVLWVKPASATGTAFQLDTFDMSSSEIVVSPSSGGSSVWGLYVGGFINGATNLSVTTGSWYPIALRMSSGTLNFFANGTKASTSATGTFTAPSAKVTIGARCSNSGFVNGSQFDGDISHFAVWERALSDSELSDMATNSKSPLYYDTNLVAYFKILGDSSPEPDSLTSNELTVTGTTSTGGPSIAVPPLSLTLTALLTPAGTLVVARSIGQQVSGTLVSSGSLGRNSLKTLTATLGQSGLITRVRSAIRSLTGTLNGTGTLRKNINTTALGTLTSSGATTFSRVFTKTLAATLASVGTLVRLVTAVRTGTLNSVGVVRKDVSAMTSGTVSPAGTITRVTSRIRSVVGSLTPSGAVVKVKTALRSVSGSLASSGSVGFVGAKTLTGTLTSTGSLRKDIATFFSGVLAAAGSLTTEYIQGSTNYLLTLTGTLLSTGTIQKLVGKTTNGTLASSGSTSNLATLFRTVTGTLTSTGTAGRQTQKQTVGSLSANGILARVTTFVRALTATLAPSGVIGRETRKTVSGVLTSTSTATVQSILLVLRTVTGTLSPAGTLARNTQIAKTRTFTPSGAVAFVTSIYRTLSGTLSPAGALRQSIRVVLSRTFTSSGVASTLRANLRAFAGTLTSSGVVSKDVSVTQTGTLTPIGAVGKYRELSFSGVLTMSSAVSTLRSFGVRITGILTSIGELLREYFQGELPSVVIYLRASNHNTIELDAEYESSIIIPLKARNVPIIAMTANNVLIVTANASSQLLITLQAETDKERTQMERQNFELARGTAPKLRFRLTSPESITGWTVEFKILRNASADTAVIEKTAEISSVSNAADLGIFDVPLTAAETSGLTQSTYYFVLQRVDAGYETLLAYGNISVNAGVV